MNDVLIGYLTELNVNIKLLNIAMERMNKRIRNLYLVLLVFLVDIGLVVLALLVLD